MKETGGGNIDRRHNVRYNFLYVVCAQAPEVEEEAGGLNIWVRVCKFPDFAHFSWISGPYFRSNYVIFPTLFKPDKVIFPFLFNTEIWKFPLAIVDQYMLFSLPFFQTWTSVPPF